MQAGLEERLIRINVTDTGDNRLIKQDRLEIPLGRPQRFTPIAGIQIERLWTQAVGGENGIQLLAIRIVSDAAKTPDIAKAQLVGIIQRKDDMRMRIARQLD